MRVTETLSTRRLNRITLARQLLLERNELSPSSVVEHLVGMQSQMPSAPYIGIWTRTADFDRDALEVDLRNGDILKATVMRQTLHLVTRRDYAVLRAALSEANWLHNTPDAERVAPALRHLASAGPVTRAGILAHLEATHGLTGDDASRAWRGARIRAHLVHHHETALWKARPEGRYVAIDEPALHDPVEARAEIVRRYLAAFGPAAAASFDQPPVSRMLTKVSSACGKLSAASLNSGASWVQATVTGAPSASACLNRSSSWPQSWFACVIFPAQPRPIACASSGMVLSQLQIRR